MDCESGHSEPKLSHLSFIPASASESFHQLLAEVTHNQTADPSMTFHAPDEQPAHFGSSVSEPHRVSAHSDPSPERFRAEESAVSAAASLDSSLSQLLASSQRRSQDSVLLLSPTSSEKLSAGRAKRELDLSFRSASPVSEGSMVRWSSTFLKLSFYFLGSEGHEGEIMKSP